MKRHIYNSDKKGPRMRKAEFSKQIVTKDLWKRFIKEFPEHSEMKWNEFYQYWKDIALTIRQETVENPLGVKLGSYNGELKLQYLPYKFQGVDMGTSIELGEKVNHINLVTRGKIAKIKWERRWAVKFNKVLQYFAFEPTREINSMAKDYIDKNPEKLRVARNTLGGHSPWRKKA